MRRKLEGMQQAVQLLHMLPRDLKCLFDGIEMRDQLHLTILLPIAVDCKQTIKIKPVTDLIAALQTATGQHTRERHLPLYGVGRKKLFISLAGGGAGKQAQGVYGVQPWGEVDEELQHLMPTSQTSHLHHKRISVSCDGDAAHDPHHPDVYAY